MAYSARRRRMPAPYAADPLEDERGLAKRKLRQLCRQVERTLITAFGDVDDERILELEVGGVLPWPNASRLLVMVRPGDPRSEVDRSAILEALGEARTALRSAVGGAISRKRVPELCFEVLLDLERLERSDDTSEAHL